MKTSSQLLILFITSASALWQIYDNVMKIFNNIVCLLCLVLISSVGSKKNKTLRRFPKARFEAIYPRGLRVFIPDENFALVNFFGQINEPMTDLGPGHLRMCEIRAPANDSHNKEWVFRDRTARLKLGDNIYYWVRAYTWQGKPMRNNNQRFRVSGFVYEDGNYRSEDEPDLIADIGSCPDPDCEASDTVVQGIQSICKGTLLFNDNFNHNGRPSYDRFWTPEIMFPEGPDHPFNVYTTGDTVSFEEETLVFRPVPLETYREGMLLEQLDLSTTCTGRLDTTECERKSFGANILPPAKTAKITTKRTFNFKYGRVEVRAKLPSGKWLVPEITLEPRENIYGNGRYASGTIRIAFERTINGNTTKLCGGPILYNEEPFRSLFIKEKVGTEDWNKDFHNYTVIWSKDGISLLVDGVSYGQVPRGSVTDAARRYELPHLTRWLAGSLMAPFDQMFYLSLGLRVGGAYDFPDADDKPYKNGESKAMLKFWEAKDSWLPSWRDGGLKVDYVKVYAL